MINYESTMKKFATNFRCLISERDVTQVELANLLDTTNVSINKWANAKSMPDLKHLLSIAELFDVTVSELLGEVDKKMDEIPRYEMTEVFKQKPVIDEEELNAMRLLHNRAIIDDGIYYTYLEEKLKEIAG